MCTDVIIIPNVHFLYASELFSAKNNNNLSMPTKLPKENCKKKKEKKNHKH